MASKIKGIKTKIYQAQYAQAIQTRDFATHLYVFLSLSEQNIHIFDYHVLFMSEASLWTCLSFTHSHSHSLSVTFVILFYDSTALKKTFQSTKYLSLFWNLFIPKLLLQRCHIVGVSPLLSLCLFVNLSFFCLFVCCLICQYLRSYGQLALVLIYAIYSGISDVQSSDVKTVSERLEKGRIIFFICIILFAKLCNYSSNFISHKLKYHPQNSLYIYAYFF